MPVTLAHGAGADGIWHLWGGDPTVTSLLVLTSWCYGRGVAAIWHRAGAGRVVHRWQAWTWSAAMLTLLAALASPLEVLADTLFSAHMAQHMLLTMVAAPLLAASAPVLPLLQGLPHRVRQRAARTYGRTRRARRVTSHWSWPLLVTGLYTAVTWAWHLPIAYEAAVRSDLIHAGEHVTLMGAAVALWWTVLEAGRRSPFGHGTGIAVVFLAGIAHGALGALLTFAPHAVYQHYVATAAMWGRDALADQQLAGVVMWAPGKIVHGIAVVALTLAWLRTVETRTRGSEATVGLATHARLVDGDVSQTNGDDGGRW